MSNSPRRTINYTPRMSQFEAYDLLPPKVQHALQEAVTAFDAYAVYRFEKKHGIRKTLVWLAEGNAAWAAKDFVPARGIKGSSGYRPAWKSTVITCKVPPLKANWTPTYQAQELR